MSPFCSFRRVAPRLASALHYARTGPKWTGVDMTRSSEKVNVVVVGGGPAGLATAIRIKQVSQRQKTETRVCVLEKADYFGGHTLSGACIDPRGFEELFPDWQQMECPVTPVTEDVMLFLTKTRAWKVPLFGLTGLHNRGNYVGRLGHVVRWMSEQAEVLGVELYAGVPVSEVLYRNHGSKVAGVATVDVGVAKDGSPKTTFARGMEFHADVTVFAEGCRGHLTKEVMNKFNLATNASPQLYGIGLKELWEVDPSKHRAGSVAHCVGWPLDSTTYGGSFVYHYRECGLVGLGLVIGLDYENPHLQTFGELQKLKTHPHLRQLLEGGKRIGYGARALCEGGFQCLPRVSFPGGCLVGDSAGFLNVAKLKGVHSAIKSGIMAADAIMEQYLHRGAKDGSIRTDGYQTNIESSWLYWDLHRTRNVRASFNNPLGLYGMLAFTGLSSVLFRNHLPFTLKHKRGDCGSSLKFAHQTEKLKYPQPDKKLTFDLPSSVYLTGTNHEHNQPSHLLLRNKAVPNELNWKQFAGPEQKYCPAGVYEFVQTQEGQFELKVNAQNCIHCKTCDIMDPTQNIDWVVPEGGGPNYDGM